MVSVSIHNGFTLVSMGQDGGYLHGSVQQLDGEMIWIDEI
jgi:hypothetical protein